MVCVRKVSKEDSHCTHEVRVKITGEVAAKSYCIFSFRQKIDLGRNQTFALSPHSHNVTRVVLGKNFQALSLKCM